MYVRILNFTAIGEGNWSPQKTKIPSNLPSSPLSGYTITVITVYMEVQTMSSLSYDKFPPISEVGLVREPLVSQNRSNLVFWLRRVDAVHTCR